MDHKSRKWAKEILSLVNSEGNWGNFHTLSVPVKGKALTTEQAIRRLYILGYTKDDAVIAKVIKQMEESVKGERKIDDYFEKKHDWLFFEKLMLASWIRRFDPLNVYALEIAKEWGIIAEKAFASGKYNEVDDVKAFTEWKGRKPKSGFETGFGMLYHAVLLKDILPEETEKAFIDYYLERPEGMGYIYNNKLSVLPENFESREASCYLAAIEVLAEYKCAKEKLAFVKDWLYKNMDENGQWDFGSKANDKVYFPLSDSWRDKENRKKDSTERVMKLLSKI